MIQHFLLLLASLLAALVLSRGVARWAEEEPELAEAARVLKYPFSVALLVALVSAGSFYPLAPGVVGDLIGAALLIPALRLLPPLVERPVRPLIYGLAGFYLFSQFRELLDGAPVLARYLFSAEVVAAVAFVIWLTRPARLEKIERPSRLIAFLGIVLRSLLALLAVAFLANLLGYFAFASILGQGVLRALYGAVVLYGAYRVMRIIVSVTLRTDTARQLRMVRVGAERIERWMERLLRIVAIVVWLDIVLDAFAIRDAVYKSLLAILTTPFAAGTISVSLADILAFAVTIAVAFLLSGFIRFVLQEDVFPRVVMQRGVSNAVSTTVHYTVLILGLLLALAAAGVDLSRLTLLAGAFGVGIGFGLQNIVNNFVSGLILLFERPIQVGDTVEVTGLLGDVKRIGMRSSTVRTFDGAEVIVPNGHVHLGPGDQLDALRPAPAHQVGVGVAYGTDPERVIEILRRSGAGEPRRCWTIPSPHGSSRASATAPSTSSCACWIPRYEEGFSMRSQLWVAIQPQAQGSGHRDPLPAARPAPAQRGRSRMRGAGRGAARRRFHGDSVGLDLLEVARQRVEQVLGLQRLGPRRLGQPRVACVRPDVAAQPLDPVPERTDLVALVARVEPPLQVLRQSRELANRGHGGLVLALLHGGRLLRVDARVRQQRVESCDEALRQPHHLRLAPLGVPAGALGEPDRGGQQHGQAERCGESRASRDVHGVLL